MGEALFKHLAPVGWHAISAGSQSTERARFKAVLDQIGQMVPRA